MSTIEVHGISSLKGEIEIQGSKNAVLPMMAAAVLHRGTTVLTNVPRIQDVFCMMGILEYMGCVCRLEGSRLTICAATLTGTKIPEHYVRSMRSSIMVLGALLGRAGEAATHYPGGCSIGKRPIDLHLYALRKMGAEIKEEEDRITAWAPALSGARISFPFPSVGATENALLAAVTAKGTTEISGCAQEPEIEELCRFLINMGASIEGIGTGCLLVHGQSSLHDSVYRVAGDRIVTGTYLAAAMMGNGQVALRGADPMHLTSALKVFQEMGAQIRAEEGLIELRAKGRPLPVRVKTGPYPQFPTDLQSPLTAVMSIADGVSTMEENVFEGRYKTAHELAKLGAKIEIEEKQAIVHGVYPLAGASVNALDLRGGAALVIAGLATEGITTINQCHHIFRGYEDICRDLSALGAEVRALDES